MTSTNSLFLLPNGASVEPLDHELVAKFEHFIARFTKDSDLRDRFLADPAGVLAAENVVELPSFDMTAAATIGMRAALTRSCECEPSATAEGLGAAPPFLPPGHVPAAHWWGFQIPISRHYIGYVMAGHGVVALIAGLFAAAMAAAGIAVGVVIGLAFAAYMIAQILLIAAVLAGCPNSPGVWFSMLWAVPGVFVPTCI